MSSYTLQRPKDTGQLTNTICKEKQGETKCEHLLTPDAIQASKKISAKIFNKLQKFKCGLHQENRTPGRHKRKLYLKGHKGKLHPLPPTPFSKNFMRSSLRKTGGGVRNLKKYPFMVQAQGRDTSSCGKDMKPCLEPSSLTYRAKMLSCCQKGSKFCCVQGTDEDSNQLGKANRNEQTKQKQNKLPLVQGQDAVLGLDPTAGAGVKPLRRPHYEDSNILPLRMKMHQNNREWPFLHSHHYHQYSKHSIYSWGRVSAWKKTLW